MSREKIVIVGDNDSYRHLLLHFLSENGYEVIGTSIRMQSTVSLIRTHTPDVILVDMESSPQAGIEVCTEIRKFSDCPILLICADNDAEQTILGLSAGGDDYISSPLNLEILLAQIKAIIRRYQGAFPANRRHLLHFPGLQIDLSTQSVTSHGREASLSAKEFQLLAVLAKHPNRIYHIEALYDLIWSDNKLSDLRTVMVHIYNLRQKIEPNPNNPFYIRTIRGAGYKFDGKSAL